MKKHVQPMATCHDVGACLLRPDCPCTGACDQARLRLAPGVIDGPYYPVMSRTERVARLLLLGTSIAGVGAVLVQFAQLAGWL